MIAWQTILPCVGLIALSFAPILLGRQGLFYVAAAFVFSICFLHFGIQLILHKTNAAARHLLLASIVYLPVVFLLMVLTRTH